MKTVVKLKPGQKGTKKLLAQYGDALLCVRYRYDVTGRKFKTVEIVVSDSEWTPPPPKYPPSALVALRIGVEEKTLQRHAKAAGGVWDRERHIWLIRYGNVPGVLVGRIDRVVHEQAEGPIKLME